MFYHPFVSENELISFFICVALLLVCHCYPSKGHLPRIESSSSACDGAPVDLD